MKVIELFNKIHNKESLPDKLKLQCVNGITENNNTYRFNPIRETYTNSVGEAIEDATLLATLLDLEVVEENES